jgi:threonine/homoserine/homoserine lactone efflux protein
MLPDLHHTSHFWLYFLLVAGIIALPGMEMAFALSSALVNGRAAGFAAVAGSVAGGLAHVALSTLGVGLLLQFPLAFNVMLLSGAVYVGWMGLSLWRSASALTELAQQHRQSAWHTFWRALMTCLLNPKAYVFMLAVFPQFIKPQYGSLLAQSVVLWLLGAVAQVAIYGAVVLAAGWLSGWLKGSAANQRRLSKTVGVLLIATALWTLTSAWQGLA